MKTTRINLFFLITAIVGVVSFFLPWFNLSILGLYSGYDVFYSGDKLGVENVSIVLILPLLFIIITVLKLQLIEINGKYVKIIETLPLLSLIFIFFYSLNYFDLQIVKKTLFEISDIGLLLFLLSSVLILFSPFSNNYKRQFIITTVLFVLLTVVLAVFVLQDTRDMKEVAAEQEQSIDEVTEQTLNDDNDLFNDDVDFGDVEAAPLALDTTKAEK